MPRLRERETSTDDDEKRESRKLPAALTLLALETRSGLSEAVLAVPELKRALSLGHLRVLTKPTAAEKPPKKKDAKPADG